MKCFETYQIFKGPKYGCCDNAKEQSNDVQNGGGPEQPVQVNHILTAAHAKELIIAGRLFRAGRDGKNGITSSVTDEKQNIRHSIMSY